jgi:secondary thiamine-phosphate synthase enzyme
MACLLSERLSVATQASFQCVAITESLQQLVERSGLGDGVLVAAGQHTTTALVVNENEQRLLADLEAFFQRLVPKQHPWLHNDLELRVDIPPDEPRNAHSHLIALMLGNHLTLPIHHGRLGLGRYQEVLLVELDGPRQRELLVQVRE